MIEMPDFLDQETIDVSRNQKEDERFSPAF